jgi:hypothetical protein
MVLTVAVIGFMLVEIKNNVNLQQSLYDDVYNKANKQSLTFEWPKVTDFKISVVAAIMMFFLQEGFTAVTWKFFYSVCKEKDDEVLREIKTRKATERLF